MILAKKYNQAKTATKAIIGNSIIAWFETFAQILTKSGTVIGGYIDAKPNDLRLEPNILQQRIDEAVRWMMANGVPVRLLALKPRQKGCSTFIVGILYWFMRKYTCQGCIIGGKLKQVRSLWIMLIRYWNADQHDWGNDGNIGATSAAFSHGSTCIKETAKDADAGRAGTIHALIVTEAARWSEYGVANAAGVLNGIENCVPYEPNTFEALETTARGASGPFWERWETNSYYLEEFIARYKAGTLGATIFVKIFAGWHEFEETWIDPLTKEPLLLTPDQRRELKRDLTDHEKEMMAEHGVQLEQIVYYRRILHNECQGDLNMMKREYPTTSDEAFSSSIPSRFDVENLKVLRAEAVESKGKILSGLMENPSGDSKIMSFVPDADNARMLLADVPVPRLQYVCIIDPATGESMTEGDDPDCHSVLIYRRGYIDPERGWMRPKIVACNMPEDRRDVDVVAEDAFRMAKYYGDCPIIVEVNKDPGFIVLLKMWGSNLYERETSAQNKRQGKSGKLGFVTKPGASSEQGMNRRWVIENLARSIRELGKEYEGIEIPFLHIVQELTTFVNYPDGTPRALEGCHDDNVLALAIGHANEAVGQTYKKQIIVPELPRDLQGPRGRGRGRGRQAGRRGYS